MIGGLHVILGATSFALGTVVGSFLNVCIYRIPWEKSVIWPASRCPKCLGAIAPRDNIPILGWLALRGECRNCNAPISGRYPAVEFLVGLLFLAVYLVDVASVESVIGHHPELAFARMLYHLLLVALLVTATFIDFDLYIIPDSVTVSGMVLGLAIGAIVPGIRPDPSDASTISGGLGVGLLGWAVGGALVWAVRILGGLAFRKEAMGFGDVTLQAMIGAFLGWQAAILGFFLAAFLGLGHAVLRVVTMIAKRLSGRKLTGADHEIPFGPYLSMAAIILLLAWPRLWTGWAEDVFQTLGLLARFLTGQGV